MFGLFMIKILHMGISISFEMTSSNTESPISRLSTIDLERLFNSYVNEDRGEVCLVNLFRDVDSSAWCDSSKERN